MHWLDKQGIAYETIDVDTNEQARADMLARTSGQFVVPVTAIGDETFIGFDRPGIKKAIKRYDSKAA
jgi:glutaredoxin